MTFFIELKIRFFSDSQYSTGEAFLVNNILAMVMEVVQPIRTTTDRLIIDRMYILQLAVTIPQLEVITTPQREVVTTPQREVITILQRVVTIQQQAHTPALAGLAHNIRIQAAAIIQALAVVIIRIRAPTF